MCSKLVSKRISKHQANQKGSKLASKLANQQASKVVGCFVDVAVVGLCRDVFKQARCDEACYALAHLLGWEVRFLFSSSGFCSLLIVVEIVVGLCVCVCVCMCVCV